MEGALQLAAGERGSVVGTLQMTHVAGDWRATPLRATLKADSTALVLLHLYVPEIDRAAGDLFLDLVIGGTLGALLTGVLAVKEVNANLTDANAYAKANKLFELVGNGLWIEQLKAMAITIVLAVVATAVIAYIVKALVGLRPTEETETIGLDLAEHGEEGYHG